MLVLNQSVTLSHKEKKLTSLQAVIAAEKSELNERDSFHSSNNVVPTLSCFIISCRFCKTSFKTIENCQRHICVDKELVLEADKLVEYSCQLCSMFFKNKVCLDKHLKSHYSNKCIQCGAHFLKRNELCKHLKTEHNITEIEKKFNCSLCKKMFSSKSLLNVHMQVHVNGKLSCKQCGLLFENENCYAEHIKTHFKYECQLCNKMFARNQQFNQHMRGHQKHVCNICDLTYPTGVLLTRHQQKMHYTKVVRKHQCQICKKCFNRPINLIVHQRIHTGEKPLKCLDCNENYYSRLSLAKHLKTAKHLKKACSDDVKDIIVNKKYTCEKCESTFLTMQSLSRHVQILHSVEQPLKCDKCDYSTKCAANLKRHSELHAGTKSFICELCGQVFRALRTLKDHHVFVHSDKRDFLCGECNKSFKKKSDLQRHKKIHSNDRPYKCSCIRTYKRLSHLKRHVETSKHVVSEFNEFSETDEPDEDIRNGLTNKNVNDEFEKHSPFTSLSNRVNSAKDLNLCFDDNSKASETITLYTVSPVENLTPTSLDFISTKNDPVSPLSGVIGNPIVLVPAGIKQPVISNKVPSGSVSIPAITHVIIPPILNRTNLDPSENIVANVLVSDNKESLRNCSEDIISKTIPTFVMPSEIGECGTMISVGSFVPDVTAMGTTLKQTVLPESIAAPAENALTLFFQDIQDINIGSNNASVECKLHTITLNTSENINTINTNNSAFNNSTSVNILDNITNNRALDNLVVPKDLNSMNIEQYLIQNSSQEDKGQIPAIQGYLNHPDSFQNHPILTQNFDFIDNDNDLNSYFVSDTNLDLSTGLSDIDQNNFANSLLNSEFMDDNVISCFDFGIGFSTYDSDENFVTTSPTTINSLYSNDLVMSYSSNTSICNDGS